MGTDLGKEKCGSCSLPIEPNARQLFKLLNEDSDDELNLKKSDPNLYTTTDCFGLSTEEAHNTIENILVKRRYEKNFALTQLIGLLSLLISFLSLVISLWRRPKN